MSLSSQIFSTLITLDLTIPASKLKTSLEKRIILLSNILILKNNPSVDDRTTIYVD